MDAKGKIGLIMPELTDALDLEFVEGIFTQSSVLGLDVVIYTGNFNSYEEHQQDYYIAGMENIYSLVCKSRLDGILFAADRFHNQRVIHSIFDFLSQTDIPCLATGCMENNIPCIDAEQYSGAYAITKHLIDDHGCKRLYCMAGVPNHAPSAERLQGVLDAVKEAGLSLPAEHIFYGYYWKDIPRQIATDICDGKLECPDGIVCLSDVMAIEMMEVFKARGIRIPEEIAVTGYDGMWYSVLYQPQVTTVCGRDRQYGEAAVCRLYELMYGNSCTPVGTKQEIRYGMSCGCGAEKLGMKNGILYTLEKHFVSKLLLDIDKKTFLATDYIDNLSDAKNLTELIESVDAVAHILRGWKWIDLCLCEDWKTDSDVDYRQHSFSDQMYLGLSKRHGENAPAGYIFPTETIIPALDLPHKPAIVVLTSLHCKGHIFGYLAITYSTVSKIDVGESHIRWCDAVASGLNALQKHLYAETIHQQMALLSTTDPMTDLPNQRGFLEQLPEQLYKFRKAGKTGRLLLISWVRESTDSVYDTRIMIANFLKEASHGAFCARLSDKCFSVLTDAISEAEILSQLERSVTEFLWGTATKPELITEATDITVKHPVELEQMLNEQMEGFAEKCHTAESTYESYKQMLSRLRREIQSQPEIDWNMTDITHDLGLSKTHLNRLYKSLFAISIKDEIIQSRIARAKQLLRHTELRIHEIADRCGYQNETHFMRQFKEKTGITATAYRKQPE